MHRTLRLYVQQWAGSCVEEATRHAYRPPYQRYSTFDCIVSMVKKTMLDFGRRVQMQNSWLRLVRRDSNRAARRDSTSCDSVNQSTYDYEGCRDRSGGRR